MKIEIKHLAPFLPYRLKTNQGELTSIIDVNIEPVDLEVQITEKSFTRVTVLLHEIKPFLRPLGQLTQEIEHYGERFVPIVELLKLKYADRPKSGKYSEIECSSDGYPSAWYVFSSINAITLKTNDIEKHSFLDCSKNFTNGISMCQD